MNRRDAVLGWLTDRVRFATTEHVAALLGLSSATIDRELRSLDKTGWVGSASFAIRRPAIACPMMTDHDPVTVIPSVAWKLETRWMQAEPQRTRIWWASKRAATIYGGRYAGVKQQLQIEHDLMLLDVLHRQDLATLEWLSEDDLRDSTWIFDGKLPDAIITDGNNLKVIEIGGQYSVDRLRAFVSAMTSARLAFEIW